MLLLASPAWGRPPGGWALLLAAISCSSGGGEPALEFAVVHTDALDLAPGPHRLRIVYDYRGVRPGERRGVDDPAADLWRDHEAGAHTIRVE